jgi:SAM-dependent methyltransferase
MIDRSKEPFGVALNKYFMQSPSKPIYIKAHMTKVTTRDIAVQMFFESPESFPEIDRIAYQHCYGRILDIGAGVGRFSLPLQEQKMNVVALEHSPDAAAIMKTRGVKDVRCMEMDEFLASEDEDKFDTLLMIMNGLGIVGTIANLEDFLEKIKPFVSVGGQILADSTNVKANFHDDFSTHINAQNEQGKYFGEIEIKFEYEGVMGPPIQWLHIDEMTLASLACKHEWTSEVLYRGQDGTYLTRLTQKN